MNAHASVTDSPWFWALVFSLMALLAVAATSGKYGRRQAGIERQYQARERGTAAPGEAVNARRPYASSDQTLVPLWPLALLLSTVSLVSGWMLWRQRARAACSTSRDGTEQP